MTNLKMHMRTHSDLRNVSIDIVAMLGWELNEPTDI